MPDYILSKLPSAEFEQLCRDLLQKRENVFIESFKDGKDRGIDLRFAKGIDNTIIQAKCYKEWTVLRNKLAKEAEKVKKLNPERYIFATSAPLSPDNKIFIKKTFYPYIKHNNDILGNDDLNNLLGLHPDIECQYYRLWLCSTNILNRILHRHVVNKSLFKLEECVDKKQCFVYNNNYFRAKAILDNHHYVIISGIPGIGKTTLAEMLVLENLKDDFEEFVFVSDDINDALKLYDDNKKQIFLYDDFLGATSFELSSKSFDGNLVSLIKRIKKSNNKKFILTTREYILQEAKLHYERLAKDNIEIAKCTIDLGSYSNKIKAQILYNHLYYANIPIDCIESLLDKNRVLKIVKHQNFNPRLVETIINHQLWHTIYAGTFFDKVYQVFEHPDRIWEIAYNKLDITAQYALLILVSMPVPVLLKDWRDAFLKFAINTCKQLSIPLDEPSWKNALKILDGCYIKTNREARTQIVDFFNPSIIDYLVDYLNKMGETVNLLIDNVLFADQLMTIFAQEDKLLFSNRKVIINSDNYANFASSLQRVIMDFHLCRYFFISRYDINHFRSIFHYLVKFKQKFPDIVDNYFTLNPLMLNDNSFIFDKGSVNDKINVLDNYDSQLFYIDKKTIVETLAYDIEDVDDLEVYVDYLEQHSDLNIEINEVVEDKAKSIFAEEIDFYDTEDELNEKRDIAEKIFHSLNINADDILNKYDDKIQSITDEEEEDLTDYFDGREKKDMEDAEIIALFQSLREQGT